MWSLKTFGLNENANGWICIFNLFCDVKRTHLIFFSHKKINRIKKL